MNWQTAVGLSILIFLAAQSAHSTNLQWLKYSPVRYFNDKDWALAKSTAQEALTSADDNKLLTWNNPATGNSGSIVATETTTHNGQTCRKLQISNKAKNLEGKAVYLFCLQADGEWKISGQEPQ
jgi:surface antigen